VESYHPEDGSEMFSEMLFVTRVTCCNSTDVRDQASHPYRNTGNIIVLHIKMFTFLTVNEMTEGSGLSDSKHYQNPVSS
jgi:predicted metal-dependent enzyme (double-stranded beta helix superfamily)